MSLSGARGLVRIAKNPACHLQAAMVVDGEDEKRFYRAVVGSDYEGEYGQRHSARRRGAAFEASLYQNRAAELRNALAPVFGFDAETMFVRNMLDEEPGERESARIARNHRTRRIFGDLARRNEVPHLIIQPQLALPLVPPAATHDAGLELVPTRNGAQRREDPFMWIAPDFLVFDPQSKMYVPGELKSFIVRDGVGDPGDLEFARLQSGVQVIALRAEASRAGLVTRVADRAVFVFATPFGLKPAPPVIEANDAAVHSIRRALDVYRAVRRDLAERRRPTNVKLSLLADELETHLQDRCHASCLMASYCESRHDQTARLLGDRASDVLGDATQIARLAELLRGDSPATDEEEALSQRLFAAAVGMGLSREELKRRIG